MTRWVRWWAWLLLAAWLPATQHCRLEGLAEWVGTDPCCPSAPAPEPALPCCDVLCAGLEQGWHRVEDGASEAAKADQVVPAFPPVWPSAREDVGKLTGPGPGAFCPTEPVTVLTRCWRFLGRAALPPRAPDVWL